MKSFAILTLALLLASCSSEQDSTPVAENYPDHILANVYVNGQYGYINASGEFVIEPKYALAFPFREGYACVNEGGQRNSMVGGVVGGMYYIIDADGNKSAGGNAFKAPTAVRGGLINCEFFEDRKRGLIDLDGNAVASGFSSIGPFSEGLAAGVKKDSNLMGYIRQNGDWAFQLPLEYYVGPFNNGRAFVRSGTLWGYLDTTGAFAIEPQYQRTFSFAHGYAIVQVNNSFGAINTDGDLVVPAVYDDAGDFTEDGLCAVFKDGLWGFVNAKGDVVVEPQYEVVRGFSEGLAPVMVDGQIGYINTSGEMVIEPQFAGAYDFHFGLALFSNGSAMGYINKRGEVVIEPQFEKGDNFVDPSADNESITETN